MVFAQNLSVFRKQIGWLVWLVSESLQKRELNRGGLLQMIAYRSIRSKVMGKKEGKKSTRTEVKVVVWLGKNKTVQGGAEVGVEDCHYGDHNKRFKPVTLQSQNNAN